MLLLELEIIIGGAVQYKLKYEYGNRHVNAYIQSVDSTDREVIDFGVYGDFKPTLVPSGGNMILHLPGLSGDILLVKTADKRLLRFIKCNGQTMPFDKLQIVVAGTTFDGIVNWVEEGANVPKAGHVMSFDQKSTDVVNGIISSKISEKSQALVSGLMSIF